MAESGESNGKVTLAIIATKLDIIHQQLSELQQTVKADHDRLSKVESGIEDFTALKKALLGYAVGLIVTMAMALYAVLQHTFKVLP